MKKIWKILLLLCLVFNVAGMAVYCMELFNQDIETKYVTIVDVYQIGPTTVSRGRYSRYAVFIDEEGDRGKVASLKLNVGDELAVYINLNSANANAENPEWFESRARVVANSVMGLLLFTGLVIVNFLLLKRSIKGKRTLEIARLLK